MSEQLLRCGRRPLDEVLRSCALLAPTEPGNPGVLQGVTGGQAAVVIPVQQLRQEFRSLLRH